MYEIDKLLISFELSQASFKSCSTLKILSSSYVFTINVGTAIKGISNQRRYIGSFMSLSRL